MSNLVISHDIYHIFPSKLTANLTLGVQCVTRILVYGAKFVFEKFIVQSVIWGTVVKYNSS